MNVTDTIPGIHVWLVLLKSYQALEKHAQHSIHKQDICFSDFQILEVLLHKGSMPINKLSDFLPLTSGALTSAVDRLEQKNYLERQFHETDRRCRVIHLTEAGKSFIDGLFSYHKLYFENLMDILNQDERQTLTHLLKKIGKHAQAIKN